MTITDIITLKDTTMPSKVASSAQDTLSKVASEGVVAVPSEPPAKASRREEPAESLSSSSTEVLLKELNSAKERAAKAEAKCEEWANFYKGKKDAFNIEIIDLRKKLDESQAKRLELVEKAASCRWCSRESSGSTARKW